MKTIKLIFSCVMVLLLASCSAKQTAINQLEKFSTELRDHSRYYDVQDWEKAGQKFVKITKKVKKYETEYTAEEKSRIGRLEGECAGYMARGAKDNVTDRLRGIFNEIQGIIEGITGAFGDRK